jgi:hypothetical protein
VIPSPEIIKRMSMGLSFLAALEIANHHPDDIRVESIGPEKNGKFAGWITRGPGHNFKPIVFTQAVYDTAEEALAKMDRIVDSCKEYVSKNDL